MGGQGLAQINLTAFVYALPVAALFFVSEPGPNLVSGDYVELALLHQKRAEEKGEVVQGFFVQLPGGVVNVEDGQYDLLCDFCGRWFSRRHWACELCKNVLVGPCLKQAVHG